MVTIQVNSEFLKRFISNHPPDSRGGVFIHEATTRTQSQVETTQKGIALMHGYAQRMSQPSIFQQTHWQALMIMQARTAEVQLMEVMTTWVKS